MTTTKITKREVGWLLVVPAIAVFLLLSCGDSSDPSPTLMPPSGQNDAPPAGLHPKGTYVGVKGVDGFLELVYAQRATELSDSAAFITQPCTPSGTPIPPCPPGVTVGSLTSMFPFSSCQPGYVTSSQELKERLRVVDAIQPLLYAVHEARRTDRIDAAFAVIMSNEAPRSGGQVFTFYLNQHGLLTAVTACTLVWPPEGNPAILLPPRS
jgi:hypothetical protein